MATLTVDNDADFDRLVRQADRPVLVYFWAPFCGACRFVTHELRAIGKHFDPELDIVKVDASELTELADEFDVTGIPHLAMVDGGDVTHSHVGPRSRYALEAALELTRFGPSIAGE